MLIPSVFREYMLGDRGEKSVLDLGERGGEVGVDALICLLTACSSPWECKPSIAIRSLDDRFKNFLRAKLVTVKFLFVERGKSGALVSSKGVFQRPLALSIRRSICSSVGTIALFEAVV